MNDEKAANETTEKTRVIVDVKATLDSAELKEEPIE